VIIAFAWLGHGIGGYQSGLFFDLTGTYNVSFANAVLAGVYNLLVVGSLFLTVRRRTMSSVRTVMSRMVFSLNVSIAKKLAPGARGVQTIND
jgi:hypothetical protein